MATAQKNTFARNIDWNVRNVSVIGFLVMFISFGNVESRPKEPYYGKLIGRFTEYAHNVKGTIYAVDEATLFIKGFSYDGTAPDAFFWIGRTPSPMPNPDGIIVPYPEEFEGGEPPVLQAHNSTNLILRLPAGKRIRDIKWISVWCRRFTVNFGDAFIPQGIEVPRSRVLPEFKRLAHGLRSSNITVLDARTFYIPNLHYDGAGPDAYFLVGNGSEPHVMGVKVPNEIGSLEPLRGYQGEDIEIQLPHPLTVYDIEWLSVYCIQYRHNFGHVMIPKDIDVPPALGQTKITDTTVVELPTSTTSKPSVTNCKELIDGKLQVKWQVQGEYVLIELAGRIMENQYMAFGISGSQGRPQMVGADVVVAFYDTQARVFRAEDYYMSHLAQCDGTQGVCPDERIGGRNDVTFVSGRRDNHVTYITYKRLLQTNEPVKDQGILLDREMSVIAAIGPLNSRKEANAHSHDGMDITVEDIKINFATTVNDHSCVASLEGYKPEPGVKPWPSRKIIGETRITAKIGPTGGKRGYTPITGNPSWGIAWYLNDLLIPEVWVERGQTYTFIVEGGDNPSNPAKYHPFYITESAEGGYGQLTETKQQVENVIAGVDFDDQGYPMPTAAGRYCEWEHKTIDKSADVETFEEYMKTLQLKCDENSQPAVLNWTVDANTPDLVYYQCYTHKNLGWKIHVVDSGATSKINSGIVTVLNTSTIITTILLLLGVNMIVFGLCTRALPNFKYA
uniref:CSON003313 protein n=1 Tax=Culicoides sonorensis TaxID=179676 RepID=A0A336JYU4_CULSO